MANSANDRRIDYIEMGVGNIERSKAFYGQAFGWTFKDYGPAYCEFADGRLTGGFTTDSQPRPGGPLIVLYADDLPGILRRVDGLQSIDDVFADLLAVVEDGSAASDA